MTAHHTPSPPLTRIVLLIAGLIVYGSLYPWQFDTGLFDANLHRVLSGGGTGLPGRIFLRDVVVNVAIYVPLGAAALLAWGSPWRALLLGGVLSAAVEAIQMVTRFRTSNPVDSVTNVTGTAIGVALGLLLRPRLLPLVQAEARARWRKTDPVAAALLAAWIAYLFFPYMPISGTFVLRRKVAAFLVVGPRAATLAVVSAAFCWYTAGRLLAAAGALRIGTLLA
ncbi:MAG TPA: VanZ family protein, partial [Beijerinckiaceae bacterium]|nr:VanZ family protein [Beijerinckiaceae bacterium]